MATDPEIMNALMAKMHSVIVGDDPVNNVAVPGGNYIAFSRPGISIGNEDLDFGFLSQNAQKFEAGADFADLVNTIPTGLGRWEANDRKVNDQYTRVLNTSVYPVSELSDEEEERLERAKSILNKEAEAIDLITGDVQKVIVDSPLYELYQERQENYISELIKYRTLQADLTARPDDPEALQQWNLLSPAYEQKVNAARQRWIAGGKEKVEEAIGVISALEGRGYFKYWLDLEERRVRSIRRNADGEEYLVTKYFPANFWKDSHNDSWTRFSMKHSEVHTINTESETKWGGKAGGNFGLWNIGGSAKYHEIKRDEKSDSSFEGVDFEVLRVPLRRSWWDANVFESKAWQFDPQLDSTQLSDGNTPPDGSMVGYVSALIIARNVTLKFDTESEANSYAMREITASASGGWGPFSVKANYYRRNETTTHDFVQDQNAISIPGMQIIGFECSMLNKSPDPDEDLNWEFEGGGF